MHLEPVQRPNATPQDLAMTPSQLMELVGKQERETGNLRRQVACFQRQIFGQKNERRLPEPDGVQGTLGESFTAMPEAPPNRKSPVAAHEREHKAKRPTDGADESTLFFDDTKVPVCIIDGSRADVSFIAGMLVDKFMYHQPLYRQHQRLHDSHINVSRPWLTQLTQKTVMLIEPVFDAQLDSVRASRVKAMDETPIKAGLAEPGKMKSAHIWPVYGERDEICFPYDYLVDVLQRVGQHPASRVHELTPRLWKQLFGHNPLRSDLHQPVA
jgi:hypothetical protein